MRITLLYFIVILTAATVSFGENPNEPKELVSLRESYQKARTTAMAPIEKKYSDALASMKERLTKAGNLEGALAVDAELKTLIPPISPDKDGKLRLSKLKTVEEFTAWLMTTTWKNPGKTVYRFPTPDKVEFTKEDGQIISYPITIVKVGTISWTYASNNKPEIIEIDSDLNSAKSKVSGKLERIDTP